MFQLIEVVVNFYLAISFFMQHNRQLLKAKEKLREQARLMENTLALVSHDIRNPLGAAIMGSQVVLESPGETESHRIIVLRMLRNLRHIDSMIQSLLDVARLRAGKSVPLNLTKCDLREELSKMIEAQAFVDPGRIWLKHGGSIWGVWSIEGIRRAFDNLVDNAIKYGTPESQIEISLQREENLARLSVHNEGPEIPIVEQASVFQAFQRTLGSNGGAKKGWGLGLALVKGIAEAHGGTVKVESLEGRGTTFTLELPIHEQRDS